MTKESAGPYISKGEKEIPIEDPSGKWSELYLLPEWEEDIYDVYTVKKFGKWVMLKALKPQFADKPEYKAKMQREFDVRYNLCHPNLVMVNDLDVVPGVGLSIITDDIYGYSLRRLIDEKRLTPKIVRRLETQLLDAMQYIQENHVRHWPITPDTIIFTEYNENLKVTNVGYDQQDSLSEQDTRTDIAAYGKILEEVLNNLPTNIPKLRKISKKCVSEEHPYRTVADLQLDMERQTSSQLYIILCVFIAIMAFILIWLTL